MSPRTMVVIGIMIGSTLGGFAFSSLFGGSGFSVASLFGNLIGGITGAWLTWKLVHG